MERGQEVFQYYYPLYSKVLLATGLMPFDKSLLTIIKRIVYIGLLVCCILIQAQNLVIVDKTLANIIWMLSYTWALILFVLRYCSFVKYRKLTAIMFCDIGNYIQSMTDPVEIEIFNKQTKKSQLLVTGYIVVATFLSVYTIILLLLPTLLHAGWQLRALKLYGYIYKDHSSQVDAVCLMLTAITVVGIYAVVGTESTLAVYASYFCGLLEVASSVAKLQRQQTIAYLLAIGAVIISFAVTLFRDLLFAGGSLILQLSIMFFNNYCGQLFKDCGAGFYDVIVQSAWYNIPSRSQKILLFIMLQAIKDVECNLAGLYRLSFEGFAIMMNSSFSYFTLLCSTQ